MKCINVSTQQPQHATATQPAGGSCAPRTFAHCATRSSFLVAACLYRICLSIAEKEKQSFRPPPFDYTGPLRPAWVSPRLPVPAHIQRPDYATTGEPLNEKSSTIHINNAAEIKAIRASCKIGRAALDLAHRHCKPGVTTDQIDRVVHEFIISQDAYPSPLNYRFFPKSCCTSVNEVSVTYAAQRSAALPFFFLPHPHKEQSRSTMMIGLPPQSDFQLSDKTYTTISD